MATIKKYTKKDGSVAYMTNLYLGVDQSTGKKKRTTLRANTQRELKLKIARLELDIEENGIKEKPTNITFKEVYDIWLPYYKATVKESTYAFTLGLFDTHIIPSMGNMRLNKLTILDCQKLINNWFKVIPNRYKRVKNNAIRVIDYAVSLSIVNDNPMKKVILPNAPQQIIEKTPENFYDKEELKKFLEAAKNYNQQAYIFFRVLAFAGLRKGEAYALTWDDLDLNKCELTVNKTLARGLKGRLLIQAPKTKSGHRTISLDDKTILDLKQWKNLQKQNMLKLGINLNDKSTQLIFGNLKNGLPQPNACTEWLEAIYKKTDLKKITPHGFRHTHCSLLFEASTPEQPITIKDVQERLGHSDIRTTMDIYTHVTEKAKNNLASNFSKYMEI
ncbi:tyrosine-type recombinase/integrase [Carnobacterium maltaromaticum]|uniref:tyrosine-type recombinase/integrase n=1 Tax=Carnobacterium maltaromaticum TaxID=2751 RepID=UPI0039AEE325